MEVADFEVNADWRMLEIRAALSDGIWQPGPYGSFEINDKGAWKS